MFHRFISRLATLLRRVRRAGMEQRTVLAVTRSQRDMTDLRVLAIQQGWSIRFATTLPRALEIRPRTGVCVIVYDRDLPRTDWAHSVKLLAHSENPVFCILLADRPDHALRKSVVRCGGFDVASKPMDRAALAALATLINGALALASEIDACQAPLHV